MDGIEPIIIIDNRSGIEIIDINQPECGESIILLLNIYSQGLDEAIPEPFILKTPCTLI